MSVIIEAKDIYKEYRTSSGIVYAVNGISINLEKEGFYVIIGKSGSGKSTLLHILSGLDKPTRGQVFVAGENLYEKTDEEMAVFRRRQIGFVFQQYNLIEDYDVMTNICMPMKLDKRKPDIDFVKEVVRILGISQKLKKYPAELSGGEQQRVAIARSIAAKPQIIFADEPTGNLDKKTGEETLELLKECSRNFGQTLIVVTHDLEITKEADLVYKIEDGKLSENIYRSE